MKRLLFFAVAILMPACSADAATSWWMLNARDSACVLASVMAKHINLPSFSTPAGVESSLRNEGFYKETKISRGNDGQIVLVRITTTERAGGMTIMFFPSKEGCEIMHQILINGGDLANPGELN